MEKGKRNIKKVGIFPVFVLAIALTGSLFANRGRNGVEVKEFQPIELIELEEVVITPEPEEVAISKKVAFLYPVEPETPEERELREFRRFVRWLEEFLQEQRIIVKDGIYISLDSIFRIRRVTPDLPFRLIIGNAAGYRELRLLRVKVLSPKGEVLYRLFHDGYLPSIKRGIDYLLLAREEKIKELLAEGRLLLKEEMTAEERKRSKKIMGKSMALIHYGVMYEKDFELLRELKREMDEGLHTISGSLDLTPYLKEVGDIAEVTVEMLFIYACDISGEIEELRVEKPFLHALGGPLPRP